MVFKRTQKEINALIKRDRELCSRGMYLDTLHGCCDNCWINLFKGAMPSQCEECRPIDMALREAHQETQFDIQRNFRALNTVLYTCGKTKIPRKPYW